MKVIIGLGNPGNKYKFTRHNAGFLVIDEISKNKKVSLKKGKFAKYISAQIKREKETVCLMKPLTYMNLSGEAVAGIKKWLKVSLEELLIVCDDANLSIGSLRFRAGGSSGGHNGLESIVETLRTTDFARLKIGIGRPVEEESLEDYVLKPIRKQEMPLISSVISIAAGAALFWADFGLSRAMNKFNNHNP